MKKRKLLSLLILLSSIFPVQAMAQTSISCKVVSISDGDSFTCLTPAKKNIKVRMNQIDAPERQQDFGNAARRKLSEMIYLKNVRLTSYGKDKYKRVLAEVFVNNQNINQKMVESGYAWAYREYLQSEKYLSLEQQARNNLLGLWSQPNPIYPSDFRKQKTGQKKTQTKKIGSNKKSAFSCGQKNYCKEMNSCAEARFHLQQCGLHRLDGDGDGRPCESLCLK